MRLSAVVVADWSLSLSLFLTSRTRRRWRALRSQRRCERRRRARPFLDVGILPCAFLSTRSGSGTSRIHTAANTTTQSTRRPRTLRSFLSPHALSALHRLTNTIELPVLLVGGESAGSVAEIRYLHAKGELNRLVSRRGAKVDGAKKKKGRKH